MGANLSNKKLFVFVALMKMLGASRERRVLDFCGVCCCHHPGKRFHNNRSGFFWVHSFALRVVVVVVVVVVITFLGIVYQSNDGSK